MLDLRIYRAAFVPVLLAIAVFAFSLGDRPRPIGTTLAPDAFDGERAVATLQGLALRFPDRRPGSGGDFGLAEEVQRRLRAAFCPRRGSCTATVRTRDFDARTIDGSRRLRTVVAERPGNRRSRIVLVAHRDAAGRSAQAELSGTAALLELAQVFRGRATDRTLTLVSTSGGSGGAAGAADWAGRLDGPVDAVIVLGDLGGPSLRKPLTVATSNGSGTAPLRLRRTVEDAVRAETGQQPGGIRAGGQLLRLAFPLTVGEHGPIAAHGLPTVLLSTSGELGPEADQIATPDRLDAFGRAALRSVTALDNGPDIAPAGPEQSIVTRNQVLPAWAIRLLSGALLLPPLLAVLDGVFRVRRRKEPVGRWTLWALAGALPFLVTWGFLLVLRATGVLDAAPGAPVRPGVIGVDAATLAATAAVLGVGWMLLRLLAVRRFGPGGPPGSAGSAAGVALVAVGAAILVWVLNPFAALFLALAANLWVLAVAPEVRGPRVLHVGMVLLGLAPLAVAVIAYGQALDAGPVDLAWMALLLVAGGHVGPLSMVLWSVVGGSAVSALLVVARREKARPAEAPGGTLRSRGPLTYAGPGSLGGTDSALRR